MNFDDYQEYLHELIHLKKDSMGLFEIRLLNGDIKCIDPYFDGHLNLQRSYHKIMAQHGLSTKEHYTKSSPNMAKTPTSNWLWMNGKNPNTKQRKELNNANRKRITKST